MRLRATYHTPTLQHPPPSSSTSSALQCRELQASPNTLPGLFEVSGTREMRLVGAQLNPDVTDQQQQQQQQQPTTLVVPASSPQTPTHSEKPQRVTALPPAGHRNPCSAEEPIHNDSSRRGQVNGVKPNAAVSTSRAHLKDLYASPAQRRRASKSQASPHTAAAETPGPSVAQRKQQLSPSSWADRQAQPTQPLSTNPQATAHHRSPPASQQRRLPLSNPSPDHQEPGTEASPFPRSSRAHSPTPTQAQSLTSSQLLTCSSVQQRGLRLSFPQQQQQQQQQPFNHHPPSVPRSAASSLQTPALDTLLLALANTSDEPPTAQQVAALVTHHAADMAAAGRRPRLGAGESDVVFGAVWNSWRPLQAVLRAVPANITTPALNQALLLAPGWADVLDVLMLVLRPPTSSSGSKVKSELKRDPAEAEAEAAAETAAAAAASETGTNLRHAAASFPDSSRAPVRALQVGVFTTSCLRLVIRRAPTLSSLHAVMMLVGHVTDVRCFAAAAEKLRELAGPLPSPAPSSHSSNTGVHTSDAWRQQHGELDGTPGACPGQVC
ncbi:MAG: hypothetical protein WDW36_008075 [Sanguina aurantia]